MNSKSVGFLCLLFAIHKQTKRQNFCDSCVFLASFIKLKMLGLRTFNISRQLPCVPYISSGLHTSTGLHKDVAGRYKATLNRTNALTYEMAFPPEDIAHKKGYNSFNTAQLVSRGL